MHKRNFNITLVLTTSTRHRYTGVWHRSGRSKTLDIANVETIQKYNEIEPKCAMQIRNVNITLVLQRFAEMLAN